MYVTTSTVVVRNFNTSIGVDDEVGLANGSVVFRVYGDSTLLYDSGVITGSSSVKNLSLGPTGYKQLRLVVTNGGDNDNYDHADWANARVTCN